MNKAAIFLATPQSLTVFMPSRGQLARHACFENTPDGHRDFLAYLAANHKIHYRLAVDTADESCIRASIPRLRGADRQALVQNRIQHAFPPSALTFSTPLGINKAQPPQEELVISGLSQADKLGPWLDSIKISRICCNGIFTLSQIGPLLLKTLGHDTSCCLLLAQCGDVLRQSFLLDGQNLLIRQSPLLKGNAVQMAEQIRQEHTKLRQYLIGQREITRDTVIPTYLIAQHEVTANIDVTASPQEVAWHMLETGETARRLEISAQMEEGDATVIFLGVLSQKQPSHKFKEARLHQTILQHRIRRATVAASIGMAIVATGLQVYLQHEISHLERQTSALSSHDPARQNPPREASAAALEKWRNLNQLHTAILGQIADPVARLGQISQVLTQYPEVELDKINWQNDAGKPPESTQLRGRVLLPESTSARMLVAYQDRLIASFGQVGSATVDLQKSLVSTDSSASLAQENGIVDKQARHFALLMRYQAAP